MSSLSTMSPTVEAHRSSHRHALRPRPSELHGGGYTKAVIELAKHPPQLTRTFFFRVVIPTRFMAAIDDAVTVDEAARVLGVTAYAVRRWIGEGAPVVRRGRKGRGHPTLVSPTALDAWREARKAASSTDALLMQLAAELPAVLAVAAVEGHRLAEGVDKRKLAGIAVAMYYVNETALRDWLRERCATVPDVSALPSEIERLRKIAERSE